MAETISSNNGRMLWQGVARGDKIEGTMRWYPQPGAAPVVY
jgi:hypothetical protein